MIMTGTALKNSGTANGTYIIQNELSNGYPYWQHESKDRAIWWEKSIQIGLLGQKIVLVNTQDTLQDLREMMITQQCKDPGVIRGVITMLMEEYPLQN